MPDDETISSLPPDVQALVEEAMANRHPDTPGAGTSVATVSLLTVESMADWTSVDPAAPITAPADPDGQPPAEPPPPVATAAPEPEPEPESAPFLAFEHVYERVGCGNHARRVTRDREPATPPEGHRFVQTYTLRFDTAAQRDAALV